MNIPIRQIGSLLSDVAVRWGAFMAVGSFLIYLLGYLALRFQLTALGVGTDLDVLDERYLFAGARFLVYLASAIPVAIMFISPLAGLVWLIARVPAFQTIVGAWRSRPAIPLLTGIVVSVLSIQMVMRQCFLFDNLLLRETLPSPEWFARMLTGSGGAGAQVYFGLLLASIGVSAVCAAVGSREGSSGSNGLLVLLLSLVTIQVLLLPVNYGVLRAACEAPRLSSPPEMLAAQPGTRVWLIWEGKTGATFLLSDLSGGRRLLTLPRQEMKRVEIVAYDTLVALRGAHTSTSPSPPSSPEGKSFRALVLAMGLPASPLGQRQVSLGPVRGNIVVVDVESGKTITRAIDGNYQSPLYLPGGTALLALRGTQLMHLKPGYSWEEIAELPGAERLIGVSPQRPEELYFLAKTTSGMRIHMYNLASKAAPTEAAIPEDEDDEAIIDYIRGDDREYRDARLLVHKQSDAGREWTDVFIQQGSRPERKLTGDTRAINRQPVLSGDGREVAFVRSPIPGPVEAPM